MASAAIYLNPEAYETSGQTLMGRHAAGESFLSGYLRHSTAETYYFWNVANERQERLEEFLSAYELQGKPYEWIPRNQPHRLADAGAVHIPSPRVDEQAWIRRPVGDGRYSISGITHTTATARIMASLANAVFAPVQPWDAIICTSRAVRASVATQYEALSEYLQERLGAPAPPLPRLVTIPLGLNTAAYRRDPEHRRTWRERLEIPEDEVVVLYVGRFSLTSKMNPVPMAMALERMVQRSGRKVTWVLSGWANKGKEEDRFHEFTRAHCPSVTYKVVDGRKPDTRFSIWSVADIFLSLSDNVQETFGLTPVEAMAAGLPSVVSDWDGYKDTVRHKRDGFRIPTYSPRAGQGLDLAYLYASDWDSYDAFIGQTAQFTAVDLDEATSALVELAENDELRRTMGESAAQRAAEAFDWRVIIPRYEALWANMEERRKAAVEWPEPVRNVFDNPWGLDPFRLFGAYPTEWLTPTTMVALAAGHTAETAKAMLDRPMVRAGFPLLPTTEESGQIIDFLAMRRQCHAVEVTDRFPFPRRGVVERGLLWLAKYGIVQVFSRSLRVSE
jgi:glycosyltransferase involved in cell wall biosynthesis